jgi:hypothetical protein
MLPQNSPFPLHWWGTSLENVGLDGARPPVGTYGRYDFAKLPPLPVELRGDFGWLADQPVHKQHSIADEKAEENADAIKELIAASSKTGVRLPPEFVRFMETPPLQQCVRSNTDCFLDLCPEPLRSPVGDGYLVRFLADSQGCVFWYVYITRNESDHAVLSSPDFYGTDEEQWQEEPPDPAALVFCAESFEAFLCRFWLENEIWFAEWQKTPIPQLGRLYIERYRAAQS